MKNLSKNNVSEIAHIAIAVNDLKDIKKWESFLRVEKKSHYSSDEQKVRVLVLETKEIKFEFMCPTSIDSPISNFLKSNPNGGVHHICFKIENINSSLDYLKNVGIRSITRNKNTTGISKKKVCFLNPNDLNNVLIELEEQ